MGALHQRLHREPMDEEVAAELGVELDDYRRLLGDGVSLVSLDTADHEGPAPVQKLEETAVADPLETLERTDVRARLAAVIDRMPEGERTVLARYYYEGLTMQEIGEILGVTESRVSQIHSSAIVRMRGALRRRAGAAAVTGR